MPTRTAARLMAEVDAARHEANGPNSGATNMELIKPVQRVCKYELFLREMIDKTIKVVQRVEHIE